MTPDYRCPHCDHISHRTDSHKLHVAECYATRQQVALDSKDDVVKQMTGFLKEEEPDPKVVEEKKKEESKAQAVIDKHDAEILKRLEAQGPRAKVRCANPTAAPVPPTENVVTAPLGGSRLYAEQLFKFYKLGSCGVQAAYSNRLHELPSFIEADKNDYISTIERILIKRGITYRMPDEMYLGVLCAKNVTESTLKKMSIEQRALLKNIMDNPSIEGSAPADSPAQQTIDVDTLFD